MRFATIREGDRLTGAVVEGDTVFTVDAADAVAACLRRDELKRTGEIDAKVAHFARASPAPAHILCIGLNYRSHIRELGRPVPAYPTMFAKFASTLTGPREEIQLPSVSSHVDEEAELAVIIGRRTRRVAVEDAAEAIAGFAVANDLSMRDWQHRTSEALQGKIFDRSTPLGPLLVTPDEIDGGRGLRVTAHVDEVLWQEGNTDDLLFSPEQLVSYCSHFLTLQPGDVILTGTPAKQPGIDGRLQAGTLLTTTIEGLGSAVNALVPDSAK